jgi:acyl carrier protein
VRDEREQGPSATDEGRVATLLEVIRSLVAEVRPAAAGSVRLGSRLEADLGLDSLAVAELLVRVEERFACTLPEEVLVRVETPSDLLRELSEAQGRPTSVAVGTAPIDRGDRSAADRGAPDDVGTLVGLLEWHAEHHPDRTHLRVLGGHEQGDLELTYGQLLEGALRTAAGLRQRQVAPGSAVAVMLPTSREYFTTFFGVLLAGCIPAPIYPPGRPSGLEDHLRRHVRVLDNAGASALVTVPEARPLARLLTPHVPTLRELVTPADLEAAGGHPPRVTPAARDTALLQYTSGSTGDPKGVVLSHANLLANIRAMREAGELSPEDVFVSWLPLYHDMGLIGSWLLSLATGIPFVVLSPLRFLTRPVSWFQAIHEHGGTVSGGPNFGYELCLRRIDDDELEGIDLRSWRLAFNGAEPVSPHTVTRFIDRFSAVGFRPGAMTPVYGLAESSVALTVPPIGRGPVIDRVAREPLRRTGRAIPVGDEDGGPAGVARFVSCGAPMRGHELRIVGRDGTALGERSEGRVQFRGPSATSGYHRNPAATDRLFDDGWLETGDLGYLASGELHLTGRLKDLIVRAGRNLHPSELEEAVGAIDGVRRGCVAVFPTTDPRTGTEQLVVLAETRRSDAEARAELHRAINHAVSEVAGTAPDDIVLAGPGAVPKTSSGKVRRAAARERYESGQIDGAHRPVWWQVVRLAVAGLWPRARRVVPSVLATVYGIYALGLFALIAGVVFPAVVLTPGVGRRWRLVRGAGRLLFYLAGVPMIVRGTDHLPATGPYVLAANHASFLDPLVLASVLSEPPVWVAVGGLAGNPLVRLFLHRLDAHLVGRGDRVRAAEDRRVLTDLVRSGRCVAFFPEGRRSPAPGLEPFRLGAFLVAADAGVRVVPVALRGTRRLLPVGQRLPRWTRITVTVEPAVRTEQTGWAGAMELHLATRAAILRHCGEPDLA